MPVYDSTWFDPPAPLARVTLRNLETGADCQDIPMLIDSGADITVLPQAITHLIDVKPATDRNYELKGFDETITTVAVVRAEMIFLNRSFRGHFPVIDQEWGIIGRNVLNLVSLLLDGPGMQWDEHKF
jgi:hypothetical protein